MPVILPVFCPFPSDPFFLPGNTQLWGKQTSLTTDLLEERHLKIRLTFLPLSVSLLKKNESENKMFVSFPTAQALCSRCSSFLALAYLQGNGNCSFWITLPQPASRFFSPIGNPSPFDVVASSADCVLISLPKLQNVSVRYKGIWLLEFKPDK